MAGFQQRLANQQYSNWLKAGLCLIYLKDGLAAFTEKVIQAFHHDVLTSLPGTAAGPQPTCGRCTNNDIAKDRNRRRWSISCPICDHIIEILQDEHVILNLTWSAWNNTDVRLWCSDAWEIAKVYMNSGQKPTNKSPDDSDCSGLINLILHCKKFHRYIATVHNIYEQIRTHRNEVMHSKSMELTYVQLSNVVQDVITVLKDLDNCYIKTKTEPTLRKLRSSLTSTQSRLPQTQATLTQTQSSLTPTQPTLADGQLVLSLLKQARQTASVSKQSKVSQDLYDEAINSVDNALSTMEPLELHLTQAWSAIKEIQSAVASLKQVLTVSHQIQSTLDQALTALTQEQSVLAQPQPTSEQATEAISRARQALTAMGRAESVLTQTDTTVKQAKSALHRSEQGLSVWQQTRLPLQQSQTSMRQAVYALEQAEQAQWDEAEEVTGSLQQAVTGLKGILSTLDKEEQGLCVLPVALVDVKQALSDVDQELAGLSNQQSSLGEAHCNLKQAIGALTALQQVTEVRDSIIELTTHGEMQVLRDKMDVLERSHLVINQQITDLDATSVKTEQEIANIKQNSISHRADLKELTERYECLQKIVDQIGKDNSNLTAEYEVFAENIQKQVLDVTALQNKVQDIEHDVSNLQHQQERQQTINEKMHLAITSNQEIQQSLNEEMQLAITTNQEKQETINEVTDNRLSALEQTVRQLVDQSSVPLSEETVADIQKEAEVRREFESLSLADQTQSQADLYQDEDEAIVQSLYQTYKDQMILDVSPIPSFEDIPLSEVFTPIVIREDLEATLTLEARTAGGSRSADTGQSSQTRKAMESYEDMFYKNGQSQKNVYLLGKAGSGKTTFCCHLVSVWCKSLGTAHYKNPEVIHSFDFVFLVFCREAGETQKVLEMIMEQLFPGPDNKYQEFVKNLLQTKPEKCLVIIDGLDEWAGSPTVRTSRWTPSGLPDKRGLENCVVLTTSRPWRIEALRQGVGPSYRIMEIQGLTRKGIKKLTKKIVKARHDSETTGNRRKLVANFIRSVKKAKLSAVVKTPLMLVNVFTLWHECQSLDTSVCVNYSKMIESLLLHGEGESGRSDDCNRLADHPQLGRLKAEWARSEQQLPQSFNSLDNCKIYGPLIFKLARLAFDGLFHERKEMSLVFSRQDLKRYFQNSEIEVILKLGILSTAAAHSKSRERLSTVSFLHKTLQEFLAALWMSVDSCADCLSVFSKHCKCVADVNDLSMFLVFLCGLSPDKGREVWRYIGEVTALDPAVQEYRTEAVGIDEVSSKPPLQQLLLQCTAEAIQHRPDMPLNCLIQAYNIQDVYVDSGISGENLGLLLGHALGSDTGIKTLEMSRVKPSPAILETINRMVSLECLVIQSPPENSDPKQLCEVIFTAVNSLSPVTSLKLTKMSIAAPNRLFTVQLPQMLKSLTLWQVSITGSMQVSWPVTMETVNMYYVTLDHDSVLQLATWLQGSSSLQQLFIMGLECRDCGYSCLDPLDVTRHSRLHRLELRHLYVDRVQVTPSNLETVVLERLYKPGAAGSVISCLHLAPQLIELTVRDCRLSQGDIARLCSVLPRLSLLVKLELGKINCDDLAGCVSDLSRLREIQLLFVTMSDQAWSKFARSLPPTSHQLTVELDWVNIDAATVSYIAAHFTVTRDYEWRSGGRFLYFHSREQT